MILLLVKAYATLTMLAVLLGAGAALVLQVGVHLKSATVRYLGLDRYPMGRNPR